MSLPHPSEVTYPLSPAKYGKRFGPAARTVRDHCEAEAYWVETTEGLVEGWNRDGAAWFLSPLARYFTPAERASFGVSRPDALSVSSGLSLPPDPGRDERLARMAAARERRLARKQPTSAAA